MAIRKVGTWAWGFALLSGIAIAAEKVPSTGKPVNLAATNASSSSKDSKGSMESMDSMDGPSDTAGEGMAAPKSAATVAKASTPEKPPRGRLRERLMERLGRVGTETLPADLDSIQPNTESGWTFLDLRDDRSLGKPLTTAELDAILDKTLAEEGVTKTPAAASDDRFIRRVTLDVIGQVPAPADIEDYVKDRSPDKKAKLIERLLASPEFGRNWGRYWRDVIIARNTVGDRRIANVYDFDTWMAEQLNSNASWDKIVTNILTAEGLSDETPQGMLFGAHMGKPEEVSGEISRIFLGIQISCAQCHDHKTDTWKREQFHEFASFFGATRLRNRQDLKAERGYLVFEVTSTPRSFYRMPDLEDPKKPGTVMSPVFLTGQPIPMATNDEQRRGAAAAFITSTRNPLFAKAYVNRMWAELIGYGFTNPVDDLGADRPVVYPELFDRLGDSFAASGYDTKELLRLILNSKVYARGSEELENGYAESILFSTVNPSRLSADQIFDSLDWILGNVDAATGRGRRSNPRNPGVRGEFRNTFGFDPSNDHTEIDGSIPQALAMMNNPRVATRIRSDVPGTLLNKLLATRSSDEEIVRALYLRVLARKPTAAEVRMNLEYVKQIGNRNEAYEDILWSLLNTTEFVNNH